MLYLFSPISTAQSFTPRDTRDESTDSSSSSGSASETSKWLEDAFRQQDSGTSAAGLWLESKGITVQSDPSTPWGGNTKTGEWIPKGSTSNNTIDQDRTTVDQGWDTIDQDRTTVDQGWDTVDQGWETVDQGWETVDQGWDTIVSENKSLNSIPQLVEEKVKRAIENSPSFEEVTTESSSLESQAVTDVVEFHSTPKSTLSHSDSGWVGVEPITDLMPPQLRKYRDFFIEKGVGKLIDILVPIPIVGEFFKERWKDFYDNHIRPPANRQEWEERHGREHPFAP